MLIPEYVHCKPCWQLGEGWHWDYVWIQENEACDNMLDGRQVGQIQAIITVIDDLQHDDKGVTVQYTGASLNYCALETKDDTPYSQHGRGQGLAHCALPEPPQHWSLPLL